jgi:hypothetical protein
MATALEAQLAQLAAKKTPREPYMRGKPSLLYDYQKAADVSSETLLSIAQTGGCRRGRRVLAVLTGVCRLTGVILACLGPPADWQAQLLLLRRRRRCRCHCRLAPCVPQLLLLLIAHHTRALH